MCIFREVFNLLFVTTVILLTGCNSNVPTRSSSSKSDATSQKTNKNGTSEFRTGLEIPAPIPGEEMVKHIGFTASYNHKTLMPNWVAYQLTAKELEGTNKGKESFRWDPDIKGRQPNREDYKNENEWSRGHMAPKADMKWSVQAYEESYYLSNVCPQNSKFNNGSWKVLEDMARRIAKEYGSVYIVCGPIVGTNKHGSLSDKKIIIPDKFFKALLIRKGESFSAIAFIMDNEPVRQDLKKSSMSINRLESEIDFDLFYNLPKKVQESVEENIIYKDWGI